MKLRTLASAVLAGGLFAAASPSFAVQCGAAGANTVALWAALGAAGCTDPDSDTRWTFVASSANPAITGAAFNITENLAFDIYNVAFDFGATPLDSTMAGTFISFTATILNGELFDAANYDTNVTEPLGSPGGQVSTAHITGASGPVNVTLTSNDGTHAPPVGETGFTANTTIAVTDTFTTIPAGIVVDAANNSFQTAPVVTKVPEPATLLLIGAALAGAGFARRRKQV